ncbi:MAG: hypothetical protein COA52_08395 [Hyphomicrobiales bacterium]|nr:MAG: hypothetical protein COA52_08395 [Hyphomicrobiales bacterium]
MPHAQTEAHSAYLSGLAPQEADHAMGDILEKYRSILAGISETILRWRASDNAITYCNEKFSRFEGRSPEELVGTNVFNYVPISSAEEFAAYVADTTPDNASNFILRRQDSQDKQRVIKGTIRAIMDGSGNIVEYQSTARDETEEVTYLEALEALIEVSGSQNTGHQTRIEQFVRHGCRYFGMEHGLVVATKDEHYHSLAYLGPNEDLYKSGQNLNAVDFHCQLVTDIDALVLIQNTQLDGVQCQQDFQKHGIDCFIGIPIIANNKRLGIACFFSGKGPKPSAFTSRNKSFAKMLGQYVSHDLENERYQKALQRNEEELQLIFNSLPANIQYKDDKNNILRLNKSAAKSMGMTIEQATGASVYDIYPDKAEKYHQADIAVIKSNKPLLKLVEEHNPNTNDNVWYSVDKIPINIPSSKKKGLLVVITDITELKQSQKRLEELNQKLDESRKKYFEMYRSTPAMMHSSDENGQIIEVSDHWLEKLGYARHEVIGVSIQQFLSRKSHIDNVEQIWPQFQKTGFCTDVPYEYIRKSGDIIEVELSSLAHNDDDYGATSLNVVTDVTERNVALRALEKRNTELTAANEGLDRFAYVASHDLQEPLRKIRQFGELLTKEHKSDLDKDGRYFVDVMTSSATRLSLLIKSILTYSKTSNAKLNLQTIEPNAMITSICDNLELQINETHASIKIGTLPRFIGDEVLVQQLITNLLSNSIKYRHPNRRPEINISSLVLNDGDIQLMIKDNGSGIDSKLLGDVFTPFIRGMNNNLKNGSGIGLAICQSVCDRHGWTINVDSTVGIGSTFTISIPKQQSDALVA